MMFGLVRKVVDHRQRLDRQHKVQHVLYRLNCEQNWTRMKKEIHESKVEDVRQQLNH